ncbi:PP_RS20740 family protein [Rhizobium laguerreae]|uniref:PP_RS20740 family protein n=1 Tax=Rhizobium laguerreae TaxID=1076926 RepID=UPI001C9232EB|nr:hypothetical protein [Rhizobium laguerreae]MBY3115642.1 hypothetical protein [Rhizobium laguerreae]
MTEETADVHLGSDEIPEEDLQLAYGGRNRGEEFVAASKHKTTFKPWHHPVKQIVRDRQWAALTRRLIEDRAQPRPSLRYFTLPGPDLLDIRVLADICEPLNVQIEYFGFDVGQEITDDAGGSFAGEWINAESALRQAGRISADALILPDRLEDIAAENSQASAQLRQRPTFDVINIDACDHLAYLPKGRTHNTFDALGALLRHQMASRTPWLLFITTRAQPDLLGKPGIQFQNAITQNLALPGGFGEALAGSLEADIAKLGSALAAIWGANDERFLKLYCIGLGKFLLQFFHMQPNLPANVELASCYAYKVYSDSADMLAMAFRITPDPPRVFAPGIGGAAVVSNLEPVRAIRVAAQARKLQNLDDALENEADVRAEAIAGTEALLGAANYDLDGWRNWLADHERRPMTVEA